MPPPCASYSVAASAKDVLAAAVQVAGRIHAGKELLLRIGSLATLPDDSPAEAVKITRTGVTTSKGLHEEVEGKAVKKLTPEEAAAQLADESTLARSAVM